MTTILTALRRVGRNLANAHDARRNRYSPSYNFARAASKQTFREAASPYLYSHLVVTTVGHDSFA